MKTSGLSIAALGTAATGTGFALAMKTPEVVRINIPLDQRHKAISGLTIAQFTDLHVGSTIKYNYVKKVCDIIMQLHADMIVFTGDLVDGSPEHLIHDVAPLKTLEAPLEKFFITGNHEYYSGVHRWIDTVETLGFDTLLNEHRVIEFNTGLLTLAGVTDIRAGAFYPSHMSSPQKALANAPEKSFKLLLAHQPTSIYDAAPFGVDLQLSGHTHGGQYFPFGFFILLEHPFVKGMHHYKQSRIYVNQGTGYWGPPLRLGTFPEITLFTFT